MEEVRRLGALKDAEINKAKEVLAFELTKLIHSEEEAKHAQDAAKALFGDGADLSSVPYTTITSDELGEGIEVLELLLITDLASSKSEGRRLIQQGGIYVADRRVEDINLKIAPEDFDDDRSLLLRKGKKIYHRVKL